MEVDQLVRLYPRLFHMAAANSWPSISKHGLLSTQALVDLWQVSPEQMRSQILLQRRPETIRIESDVLGAATIRDQKPLDAGSLQAALVDLTEDQWYATLNERVFFFLHPERLSGLLNARSYRNDEQVVIHVDTDSLVRAHEAQIELSPINSGFAQPHNHVSRGTRTFSLVRDYLHPQISSRRTKPPWHVAELSVVGGVPDIQAHVVRVDRMKGDHVIDTLYDRAP